MKRQSLRLAGILAIVGLVVWLTTSSGDGPLASDWPQWRYDAGRGAASPHALPEELHLKWVWRLPKPCPAWPASQPWLRFDLSYSPVAAGKMLFVPSMVSDTVTALDTETGEEQWRFFTDGPVRLAPIAHRGKVYFGSDDGYLYCVDATEGTLLWRFRGGPSDRKVLGNERLISTWPIRGGPVLLDGTIYFTASIWPFMGIFVHAVDAETGRSVWINSAEGSRYQQQPHGSSAFGGFVPRGHLAATEHGVIAPGGRTPPACFDLRTGKLLGFEFSRKGGRSWQVTARGEWYFTVAGMVRIADGKLAEGIYPVVHDEHALYAIRPGEIVAQPLEPKQQVTGKKDRKGRAVKVERFPIEQTWKLPADVPGGLFLKAGSQFVLGREGEVVLIEANPSSFTAKLLWRGAFEGRPWTMLAADEKLFVVTIEGRIYCFGRQKGKPKMYAESPCGEPKPKAGAAADTSNPWKRHADAILKVSKVSEGYCVMLGLGSGGLAEALLRSSKLHLIAIDSDAQKVDAFRRRMQRAGLYGTGVSAHVGDPRAYPLPPYLAGLIVSEDARAIRPDVLSQDKRDGQFLEGVFRTLRPYGGTACLPISVEGLEAWIERARPAGARARSLGKYWSLLVREGALPGAADWTHNYADAGKSVVSQDKLARAPMGLLWFGGPSNDEVLPRHGHGPSPQIAAGRLFIEGANMLRALDIYTGRLLWQKELPGLGSFYNHTGHQPGAGEIGGNYVSLEDALYVVYGSSILVLDPSNGELKKEFLLPAGRGGWGFIAVWGDELIATASPVTVAEPTSPDKSIASADGTPIIPPNTQWQYLAGRDPLGEWTSPDYHPFDDGSSQTTTEGTADGTAGWKTGAAGFGYGDDDDRTVLSDMPKKYTRVYLRKQFDGKTAADAKEMTLLVNYDDAFIAYLNGEEVARAGVGRGRGKDASKIKQHEAEGHEEFAIREFRKLLRPGLNVIAIEGHNRSPTSSDFTLDPYLTIVTDRGPAGADKEPTGESSIRAELTEVKHASASRRLLAMDRHTGRRLWEHEARYSFRHNAIALGAGKVFCIDGLSQKKREALKRRGKSVSDYRPRLLALEIDTGEEIWSVEEDVFGTFLNYSTEYDVLLQAGSAYRDRAKDETDTGMAAYRGKDGKLIWKDLARKHSGPCLLNHDTIISQGPAYELLSGKPKIRQHPLSGQPMPWKFSRNYGCNTAVGSEHLLLFRSAAAGYYDLAGDSGSGNFGGFRSSCTSNLIVAGGLLNAPEYTRTCNCNYQNQTSLAMVHDPDVEIWTFNPFDWDGKPVQRVGINFGAPGDRRAENRTLWLDYPSRGGPSPDIPVKLDTVKLDAVKLDARKLHAGLSVDRPPDYFCYHSSQIRLDAPKNRQAAGQLNWVAASGVRGVTAVTLSLAKKDAPRRNYSVRLHFAEVDDVEPGQRVFDVLLQGQPLLRNFDIVRQAGGRNRPVLRQFHGVKVADQLQLSLLPAAKATFPPLLCGIEVVLEP